MLLFLNRDENPRPDARWLRGAPKHRLQAEGAVAAEQPRQRNQLLLSSCVLGFLLGFWGVFFSPTWASRRRHFPGEGSQHAGRSRRGCEPVDASRGAAHRRCSRAARWRGTPASGRASPLLCASSEEGWNGFGEPPGERQLRNREERQPGAVAEHSRDAAAAPAPARGSGWDSLLLSGWEKKRFRESFSGQMNRTFALVLL